MIFREERCFIPESKLWVILLFFILPSIAPEEGACAATAEQRRIEIYINGLDLHLRWPSLPTQRFVVFTSPLLSIPVPWMQMAQVPAGNDFKTSLVISNFLSQAGSAFFQVVEEEEDIDGDKLPTGLELRLGLNPFRIDSDENGIPDWEEDTDGDEYANLEEIVGVNGVISDPQNRSSFPRVMTAHFRFNTNTWVGEQGQLPWSATSLRATSSWSGTAVTVTDS